MAAAILPDLRLAGIGLNSRLRLASCMLTAIPVQFLTWSWRRGLFMMPVWRVRRWMCNDHARSGMFFDISL